MLEGLDILGQQLGRKHPKYAQALGRLGQLYVALGKDDRGAAAVQEAAEIVKLTLGDQHPEYAREGI